jgi:hypothetical protein
MLVIQQTLVVREWPLKKPGDERFFGYVVGVGVYPGDWSDDSMFAYADFAYNDGYVRYRLPRDERLVKDLLEHLSSNVEMQGKGEGGIYGKVWIELTEKGYEVDLP